MKLNTGLEYKININHQMTREQRLRELELILKEYFINENGKIDISNLNLQEHVVDFSRIRAESISNVGQIANMIFNYKQRARHLINNSEQEAGINIFNSGQKAEERISNQEQESLTILNNEQKADIIYNKGLNKKKKIT